MLTDSTSQIRAHKYELSKHTDRFNQPKPCSQTRNIKTCWQIQPAKSVLTNTKYQSMLTDSSSQIRAPSHEISAHADRFKQPNPRSQSRNIKKCWLIQPVKSVLTITKYQNMLNNSTSQIRAHNHEISKHADRFNQPNCHHKHETSKHADRFNQ